jgi:hypothetical protein
MKLQMSKIKKKHMIILATIVCGFVLLQLAPVVKAQTNSNPTIYDSTYIDKLEIEIKGLIQSSNDELRKQIVAVPVQTDLEKKLSDTQNQLVTLKDSMVFKIIKLPAGKILIGDASTEIIVRNKDRVTAYIASTATGGISNLISGNDILNGVIIPANQLLLVPKADGRGITATKDADIMIKGTYTIK